MAFNTTDSLRRILNRDKFNNFISDADLEDFLEEANKELFNLINRRFELDIYTTNYDNRGDLIKTYDIILSPVNEVKEVRVNDEIVDESNYSIDLDLGYVKFNENYDLSINDKIKIYYTPEVYVTAELYLARYNVLAMLNNQNSEGETQPLVNNAEKIKDKHLNRILNKVVVTSYS